MNTYGKLIKIIIVLALPFILRFKKRKIFGKDKERMRKLDELYCDKQNVVKRKIKFLFHGHIYVYYISATDNNEYDKIVTAGVFDVCSKEFIQYIKHGDISFYQNWFLKLLKKCLKNVFLKRHNYLKLTDSTELKVGNFYYKTPKSIKEFNYYDYFLFDFTSHFVFVTDKFELDYLSFIFLTNNEIKYIKNNGFSRFNPEDSCRKGFLCLNREEYIKKLSKEKEDI